jgi:hypothetical protein
MLSAQRYVYRLGRNSPLIQFTQVVMVVEDVALFSAEVLAAMNASIFAAASRLKSSSALA